MQTKRIISWGVALLPLVATLVMLPILPDRVPMHFDFSGNITRYGSKYEMFILPALTILIGLTFPLMEKSVIKQDGEKGIQNAKVLYWCGIIISLIFLALTILIAYTGYNDTQNINAGIDVLRVVAVCLSISYIIIGNLLPKCKQNFLVGIRTIWTLSCETSWYKTHRFGGKVMLIFGIISALLSLFVFDGFISLLISTGGLALVTILVIIYSYYVYKQEAE